MSDYPTVNGWIYNHCKIDWCLTIIQNWGSSESRIVQHKMDESLTNVKLVSNEQIIYIETQVWLICWSTFYVWRKVILDWSWTPQKQAGKAISSSHRSENEFYPFLSSSFKGSSTQIKIYFGVLYISTNNFYFA